MSRSTPIDATTALHAVAGPRTGDGPLLAVWAHPDDESFCGAGLLLAAAAAGRRVINVSATLGELGTDDPARWTPERLGRRRRAELARALDHLGGAEIELLGIRDGSCELLDDRIGTRRLASVIETHRPTAILTFGADGVTGHPDHQAIHRWTTTAAALVDRSVPVVTAITAAAWPDDLIGPLHDVGAFFPGYPRRGLAVDDVAITLGADDLDRKLAALAAHESQIGPLLERLGAADFRRLFAEEAYRPANATARRALGAATTPLAPVA